MQLKRHVAAPKGPTILERLALIFLYCGDRAQRSLAAPRDFKSLILSRDLILQSRLQFS